MLPGDSFVGVAELGVELLLFDSTLSVELPDNHGLLSMCIKPHRRSNAKTMIVFLSSPFLFPCCLIQCCNLYYKVLQIDCCNPDFLSM